MKKQMYIIIPVLLFFAAVSYAGNPLVTNVRTADANPFVYNNTFYIVCGQDEVNNSAFDMYAWRLLSSTNMRDWTDHGVILRPSDVSWMPDNRAWASCIVYRSGYFYFYSSNDWQVGVLRATNVTGPYQDVNGGPLIDSGTPGHAARDIDPMCYIDIDGQAYLFWGGDGNCRYALLDSNMTSLASDVMDVPGLSSYLEAPFIVRENDTYFLMYADSPWPSEIRYATSDSIAGPWSYRGIIGTPTGSGTNHEGAAFYKGEWWYTYHTEELSNNNPYSRSVCIDKMYINGNSIQGITYTDNNSGGAPSQPSASSPSQNPVWTGGPYNLSNDYVTLSSGIVDNLYDFTIATWVNLNTITMWTRIFDFGFNETSNMFLTPSCDTEVVRFVITIYGNVNEQRLTASSGISTGTWNHLAVTKSGNTGILYINGTEVARNTSMTLNPADMGSTSNNFIGRSQYMSDPYLDGQVDNFYIYNRALSNSEISTLANTVPGTTAPPQVTIGDANENGTIDIVDALVTAQHYVGLGPSPFNVTAADTNCDGVVDIIDALLIAQYYVGLISGFC